MEYEIKELDHFGRGIIKDNNKIIFVNDSMIGDIVKIEIVEDKKNYCNAVITEFIKKSPSRVDDFCKYKDCGGCSINYMNYMEQLNFKENKVKNIVSKYLDKNIKINSIISDSNEYYRNKITLHVEDKKIGLYKNKSNEIIEIDECRLVNKEINQLIKRLRDFIKNYETNLKEVIIKVSNLNEKMIVFKGLVNNYDVLKEFNDINSIYINDECLNNKYIKEQIGDFNFLQSKDSFFQVNRFNTIKLYDEVKRNIEKKNYDKALDLYCGTGTIGIYVSKYINEIIGIEVVEDAIESANYNKELNNVNNITFINGKVEDNIDKFNNIDLVIMDPPRSGVDKKSIDTILNINPKFIIYVSCDIMTLVRDLNILKDKYIIKEITPCDMFPNTHHCESVCILERRK